MGSSLASCQSLEKIIDVISPLPPLLFNASLLVCLTVPTVYFRFYTPFHTPYQPGDKDNTRPAISLQLWLTSW